MKQKMNMKQLQAGKPNQESTRPFFKPFSKTCIGLLMMAILFFSPALSHATSLYTIKDTCCVIKTVQHERYYRLGYNRLVKITTPDQSDFIKADREIRRNLLSDIQNEGRIALISFMKSDEEIQKSFKKEYQIQLYLAETSDEDIHNDFHISLLNWRFYELESDQQINLLFHSQGNIPVPTENIEIADDQINWNFHAQNLQLITTYQILNADKEINNALCADLSNNNQ